MTGERGMQFNTKAGANMLKTITYNPCHIKSFDRRTQVVIMFEIFVTQTHLNTNDVDYQV